MADGLRFFCAPSLNEDQVALWREFAERVPWAHYFQDPAWGEIERRGTGMGAREPWFFWAEAEGNICLTAIGVRRRLPVPGRVFWEFNKGPTFLDATVLDEWLPWLLSRIRPRTARLRVAPAMPLDQGGDDVETLLERHGFVRRRLYGGWATLLVNISGDEEKIFASFRPAAQRSIGKSLRLGIEIRCEDGPEGWRAIATLQADLSKTAPVLPVDESMMERVSSHWLRGGPGGTVLVARRHGELLAAALVVTYRGTAYLPVIPSSRLHRDMPTAHLLVWEAMRWARQHGCTTFDLVGYGLQAQPGEPLSGVNQFKRGFASLDLLTKSVAVHEAVLSPMVVFLATFIRGSQARFGRHARSHVQQGSIRRR
jgi:peptidoglycan pentaglycine glycine transferase (the first glycine)